MTTPRDQPPADLTIRPASVGDLPAIGDIYNHYVLNSTCTFAETPQDAAYWRNWLAEHAAPHPAIVAIRDSQIVGWGCLSRWQTRCAYRFSVENSVYVEPDHFRQGIGAAILDELITLAREHDHRNLIAQIADHQTASEELHRRRGFRYVGCLEKVGFKFNRWIDVALWQLSLFRDGDTSPPG